jgi:ferric-dicitrate binding protein FerR (iron transport regulator)
VTIPAYARLAAKLLKREQESIAPSAAPSTAVRSDAVAAIESALVRRTRRRVVRRTGFVGVGLAAAAALLWLYAPRAQSTARPALVANAAAAHVQDIIVHPFGSGARVIGANANGALQKPGARVQVLPQGRALLAFGTGTRVTLEEEGDLTLVENGAAQVLALDHGALRADVAKLTPGRRFLVHTADAEVEVHGTSFRVSTHADPAQCGGATRTQVEVFEGVVTVRNAGGEQRIEKGGHWTAACAAPPAAAAQPVASADEPAHDPGRAPPGQAAPVQAAAPAAASSLSEQNRAFALAVSTHRAGDLEHAAREFDRLIERFPEGPLVESATVQRMKLARDIDRPRAHVLAREYLMRYPGGFARELAQAIAEEAP